MIALYKRWWLRRKLRRALAEDRRRRGVPLGIGTLHKNNGAVVILR